MEANAKRAADDPRAIAYLGEVDRGASAVSVPRTNRADLLQVSPLDGLTSLTRRPPGRPRAGPERYYPGERRSFLRLVPPDARIAREMVALARPARGRRIALVDTADFSPRELGAVLDAQLRRRGVVPVDHVLLKDDADGVRGQGARPGGGPAPAWSWSPASPARWPRALLAELARQLPRRPRGGLAGAGRHRGGGQRGHGGDPRAARVRPARAAGAASCGAWAARGGRRRCTATTPWPRCWRRCARAGGTAAR